MALDPTSRYAALPVLTVTAPDGSVRTLGAPRVVPQPRLRGSYLVTAGDRVDLIAQAAAGDSTRWWLLADANRWWDATELEHPGTEIGLPDA